jgi:hypothetical protein
MRKTLSRSGAQVGGIENVRSPPVYATPLTEFFPDFGVTLAMPERHAVDTGECCPRAARHSVVGSSPIQLLGQERVLGGAEIEKHAVAVGGLLAEGVLVVLDRK